MAERIAAPDRSGELHGLTIIAMVMLTLSILTTIALWPRGPFYLLAVRPGMTHVELFGLLEAADGRFVADGPTRWTAFVYSDKRDFAARASASGAFLTIQSPILSICRDQS